MHIFRLTCDGHRTYPRTLREGFRQIEVIRRLRPTAHITFTRVHQELAP